MTTVRFGLIGFGAWGRYHADAIAQTAGAELVALAARSSASRDAAQRRFPHCRVFADYRQLLDEAAVDVVDVVVPNYLHFAVARDVLESGRHLLLEKPMAVDVSQCRELNRLAKEKGRHIAIGHECRLSPLWGRVRQLIDEGAIGEPRYVVIELFRRPYRQGSDGWRYDASRVGNWILEEPIHFFDLARWYLAGVGEATAVFARGNAIRPDRPDLIDNFAATVTFPQGAFAVISQTLAGFQHHQTVQVVGRTASIWARWSGAMDRDMKPQASLLLGQGDDVRTIPLTSPSGEVFELAEEIAAMVRVVRGEAKPVADGCDGERAVALCAAAQRSIDTGQIVPLSE